MKHLRGLLSIGLLLACTIHAQHIKAAAAAYNAGKIAEHKQLFTRAAEFFRKAIEIEPTFMAARQCLIDVYLKSHQRLKAASAMTQLLEIEPNASHDRILLGQILLKQGQAERALAQFSLALTTDPHNAEGLLGFAAAARRMGMKDRAAEALARGRKYYPDDKRFSRSEN